MLFLYAVILLQFVGKPRTASAFASLILLEFILLSTLFTLCDVFCYITQFISWNCTVQVIQHIVMRPEDRGSSVLAEKRCRFSMQLKLGRLHIFGVEDFSVCVSSVKMVQDRSKKFPSSPSYVTVYSCSPAFSSALPMPSGI